MNQRSVAALCEQRERKGAVHISAAGVVRCDHRSISEVNGIHIKEERRMPEGGSSLFLIIFSQQSLHPTWPRVHNMNLLYYS